MDDEVLEFPRVEMDEDEREDSWESVDLNSPGSICPLCGSVVAGWRGRMNHLDWHRAILMLAQRADFVKR